MASTDIFNASTGIDETLGFNPNWSYGSPRKSPSNYQTVRPSFGAWTTRAVAGAGRSFALTFVDRPIEQVRYIESFYHRFQRGWFTLIDHDNSDRNHVGRFTSYEDDTETANVKYTVRATFEEVPTAPMLAYPSNWGVESHVINVVDDAFNLNVAIMQGAWAVQQTPAAVTAGSSPADPSTYELYSAAPIPNLLQGDWVQIEYVGFGFRMTFRLDPSFGTCLIGVDSTGGGIYNLSLATGAATGASGGNPLLPYNSGAAGAGFNPLLPYTSASLASLFPPPSLTLNTPTGAATPTSVTLTFAGIPLDRHRVMLTANGDGGVVFPAIEVMH